MRLLLSITAALLITCTTTNPRTRTTTTPSANATNAIPGYVRGNNTTTSPRVIIFVHGIFGNGTDTWTNATTHAYFPTLVRDDPTFKDADIWVHEFPSPRFGRSYTIDELADHLGRHLQNDNVITNHQEVIFVAHSMGGIIVRDYLLKNTDHLTPDRIPLLYFFSTPTTGSEIANLARRFSRNPQLVDLRTMSTGDPHVLDFIESHWQNSSFRTTPTNCAYETLPTHGILIVQRASATHLCSRIDPINRDHTTIAKPANADDESYIAFRNAYRTTTAKQQSATLRPTWNFNGNGQALLLIANITTTGSGCTTCWMPYTTVAPNDEISLDVFAHNASDQPAHGARMRLNVPSGPIVTTDVTAALSAPSTLPIAGSVHLRSTGGPIVLVPTTGTWYPEATKESRDNNLPYNQTVADALTPEGFLLGDISPGWGHQMDLILRFRCIPATLLVMPNAEALATAIEELWKLPAPTESNIRDLQKHAHLDQGHLERVLPTEDFTPSPNDLMWVSEVQNISSNDVLLFYLYYYNKTAKPLHNLTATLHLRRRADKVGQADARIRAGGTLLQSGSAVLSFAPNANTDRRYDGAMLLSPFNTEEAASLDGITSLRKKAQTVPGDPQEGLVLGDLPPHTLLQLTIVYVPPDQ